MSIAGIDQLVYGVGDLEACRRFLTDFGLRAIEDPAGPARFETLNGCEVLLRAADDATLPPAFEAGSTVRQVTWGVQTADDLAGLRALLREEPLFEDRVDRVSCQDPSGMHVAFRVSRKRALTLQGSPCNAWGRAERVDLPSPVYERAEPVEVGHIVLFTDALDATTHFYERIGFRLSDRYPGRGHFMRCRSSGGHHNLFLLQTPQRRRGINHVAFTVRDIHEVFGGGLHMSRCGWKTQLGPGRHPVSSAYFWYFETPLGGLIEYYSNEDVLSPNWQPRDLEPGPTVFAEWAITGGIDGETRRQTTGPGARTGKFLTE
jgi:catechol 2,3-dioxygenase-like lactoylglutathione lyase family enzyme